MNQSRSCNFIIKCADAKTMIKAENKCYLNNEGIKHIFIFKPQIKIINISTKVELPNNIIQRHKELNNY